MYMENKNTVNPLEEPNQNLEHTPENLPEASPAPEPEPEMKSVNLPLRKPTRRTMDKKTIGLIVAGCVAAVAILALCLWFFWLKGFLAAKNAPPAFVSSVSSITGVAADTDPRYSGLVEPQKVTKVNKDDTRTVAEVLVMEGDEVHVGDPLFRYDTDEMQLSIRQAELELEGIANQITSLQDQKKTLEAEKKKASKDDQFKYTVEIQSVDLQIRTQEYQRSVKQTELDKLRESLDNNQVLSEVDGVVQQINLTPQTDSQGQPLPYMSILSSGEFRIKGTVTEQNIGSLYEGQAVTVYSRIDPTLTWQGTVDTIEHEPVQDNSNMYYYGGDQGEKSSKYNFFVVLNSLNGLMLGQHVYIKPDLGVSSARTGMWLPAMYLVKEDDGSAYVWARAEDETLEIRPVMLGEFDEGENLYQIVSGLEATDYIAVPTEDLVPGGPTTTDPSAQVIPDMEPGEMDPGFADDGAISPDDGAMIPEDGTVVPEDGADGSLDGEAGTEDGALPEEGDGDMIQPRDAGETNGEGAAT